MSVELFHICGAAPAPNGARPVVLSKERILIIAVRVVVVFAFLKWNGPLHYYRKNITTAVGYYSGLESPFQAQFQRCYFHTCKRKTTWSARKRRAEVFTLMVCSMCKMFSTLYLPCLLNVSCSQTRHFCCC